MVTGIAIGTPRSSYHVETGSQKNGQEVGPSYETS